MGPATGSRTAIQRKATERALKVAGCTLSHNMGRMCSTPSSARKFKSRKFGHKVVFSLRLTTTEYCFSASPWERKGNPNGGPARFRSTISPAAEISSLAGTRVCRKRNNANKGHRQATRASPSRSSQDRSADAAASMPAAQASVHIAQTISNRLREGAICAEIAMDIGLPERRGRMSILSAREDAPDQKIRLYQRSKCRSFRRSRRNFSLQN